MKSIFSFITLVLLLLFTENSTYSQITDLEEETNVQYFGNITAPDFPEGTEWFNTDKPVSIKDLRGKLVLLDFWTSGCINCIHIIPDLKMLEQKYHDELVVIGVHSAKFLNERGSESIRQSILKYDLEHPVVNDKDFIIWDNYTANAWPTLVLIDPKGKIIGKKTGEGVFDLFDTIISGAISEYERIGGILNKEPVKFALEKEKIANSLLSFPGKITADPPSSRLFVTDSNNNRVLILKINESGDEAVIEDVIGSGKQGANDGSFTETEFSKPQGISYSDNKLYVADTYNNLIREIDLQTKQVKTIAGTGKQSAEWGFIHPSDAKNTALNSPWDLILIDGVLYIAMAGPHQLWKMDLTNGMIGTYAGSGRENITDGDFMSSALAQPSGITTDGTKLYFADAESSSIRWADLKPNGRVKTIVGSGLFEFGDIDGTGAKVRLQHPLGVVYNNTNGLLYITDTYNSKIKTVNPVTKEVITFSGTGTAGRRDGNEDVQFNEPGGLVIVKGKIYITDTNNNLLRVIDMSTKEVKTVVIKNPEKLMPSVLSNTGRKKNVVKLEPSVLKQGISRIKFNFTLPDGFKVNEEAKPVLMISSNNNIADSLETEIETKSPMFELPIKLNSGSGNINLEVLIYYCETENIGICKFKELNFEIPVTVNSSGSDAVNINYSLN